MLIALHPTAAELSKVGITAKGYATDLADAAAVKRTIADIQHGLGPINILHYNAYVAMPAGLLEIKPEELLAQYNVLVTGNSVPVYYSCSLGMLLLDGVLNEPAGQQHDHISGGMSAGHAVVLLAAIYTAP